MQPIASYKGTSLYEISKYIANILKPYGKLKEQHTHNSKSFSSFICQQKIKTDEVMVSFDVTSLYSTIPIDQALLIIKDLLEHDDKLADTTLLSPRQILYLSTWYSTSTTHHILQIQWSFVPTKRWSSNGRSNRHVDDVFSIAHKTYLQELLEHIKNLRPQTQFTREEENNSTLPFLDTLVNEITTKPSR